MAVDPGLHAERGSRLDALLAGSFDLVLELDRDLDIVAASSRALEHLGDGGEALAGASLLDYVPPADRERLREWAAAAFAGGDPEELAVRLLRRTGDQPAYQCALRCFTDGDAVAGAYFIAHHRAGDPASDRRYELIFRETRNGVQVIDARTRALECNPAMAAMLGYTVDEYLSLTRAQRVHPDDLQMVNDDIERALRREYTPAARTVRMLHRDGHVVVCDTLRSIVRVDGEARYIVTEARDITDFVQMVDALERSEQRYRLLVESVVEGLLLIGPDRALLEANEAFAAMLGYTPAELIAQERSSLVYPDDWPRFQAQVDRLWSREVDRIRYQTRLVHRDGSTVYIDGIMQLLIEHDQITGAIASLRDMSREVAQLQELWQREEQYRRLFELVQHGLALADREGRLSLANGAMGRMLEYEAAEMAGLTWLDITHPDDHAALLAYEPTDARGNFTIQHAERRLLRKDGVVIETEVVTTPVVVDGEFTGTLAAYTDVSEQRRLSREVEQVTARMQHAAVRGEFLAMVSHELRTPLTAVIGFTELLELEVAGSLVERQREYLHEITQAAEQLLDLINDLLDLTRMEAGKFEVHPAAMAPAAVTGEAARMVAPLAERKNIHFRVDVSQAPADIRADPRAFRQVLNNLISNAVKFTHAGSVDVAIYEAGDRCVIEVADTGEGIPDEALERVFDPFVQVNMALDRSYGGSGLGLPICQHLVDLHGGRLILSSEQGAGTTVRAEFPIAGPPEG